MKILILFLFLLTGCQNSHQTTTFSGIAMTIEYKIIVGEELSISAKKTIEETIALTFNEIDTIFNKWNPYSELSKLNSLKAHQRSPITPSLETFLLKTKQLVELSQGLFDPTIEPLQDLWKKELQQGRIPSTAAIEKIIPAIGWSHIHLENGIFWKDHDETRLDLGGIAKGHCIDLLVERLNCLGYPNVFVEWGGEIRASGKHPAGRPWTIFISCLGSEKLEEAIDKVSLCQQAIATSGDYLQYWDIEGISYFHIFHPRTFQPLKKTSTSIASASVLASSCALADALATTALMFPSTVEAEAWLEEIKKEHPEIVFWLVARTEKK